MVLDAIFTCAEKSWRDDQLYLAHGAEQKK